MTKNGTYNDPALKTKLAEYRMPFGKHSKMLLIDLPLDYLSWFYRIGFPKGELGQLMQIVYDLKTGHMENLIDNIRKIPAQNTESTKEN